MGITLRPDVIRIDSSACVKEVRSHIGPCSVYVSRHIS